MQAHPAIWNSSIAPRRPLALVLMLAAVFAGMRFAGMLGPAATRWMLPLGFVLMSVAPWILLSREGRRQIGLCRPSSLRHFPQAVLFGVMAALVCFTLGLLSFAHSSDNWFVSIASNYRNTLDTARFTTAQLFLIFTLPAILFSPIGEEIFFRGMLQRALEQRFSVNVSTSLECAAFGIIHLCHHGLAWGAAGLTLLPVSGALWVMLMFLTALMLAAIRKRSGSLFPAMASHAAFNATMNLMIFSFLWR